MSFERKSRVFALLFSLSVLMFSFQNCSQSMEFESVDAESYNNQAGLLTLPNEQEQGENEFFNETLDNNNVVEGTDVIEDSEIEKSNDDTQIEDDVDRTEDNVCVASSNLGVWIDPEETGLINANNFLGDISSFSGALSAVDNYNYESASAHPVNGPTPVGFEMHVFFYESSNGLALNFYANVDNGGSRDNEFSVNFVTMGNDMNDDVLLSDDNAELKRVSQGADGTKYEGRFHYWSNTDGGVIGPFLSSNFKIIVQVKSTGDVNNARFYSAGGGNFSLMSNGEVSSFIIAYRDQNNCE